MAIEFRCNTCTKLLRIPDEHGGKSAQCPECGNITQVPMVGSTDAQAPPQPAAEQPSSSFDETIAHDSSADGTPGPSTENPYAPPRSAIPETQGPVARRLNLPLASRWKRLGGSILDSLVYLVAMAPGFIAMIFLENGPEELQIAALIFMFGCGAAVLIFNWYLITVTGQSIAKRMLGMRIVSTGGELPGFLMGVLVRQLIPLIINQFCNLFSLFDALFIFGEEKRCIHDYMAQTVVIDTELEGRPTGQTSSPPAPTASWTCVQCGATVPATWSKCSSCGSPPA